MPRSSVWARQEALTRSSLPSLSTSPTKRVAPPNWSLLRLVSPMIWSEAVLRSSEVSTGPYQRLVRPLSLPPLAS